MPNDFTTDTEHALRRLSDGVWQRTTSWGPAWAGPDTVQARLTGTPPGLDVDVFFFDPLAAHGLYTDWEDAVEADYRTGDTGEAEIPMGWIPHRLEPDEDGDGTDFLLSFPTLRRWTPSARNYHTDRDEHRGQGREHPYENTEGNRFIRETPRIRCNAIYGAAEVLPADGHLPERFRLRAPGHYVVHIWLRPRSIVLHWSAGGFVPGENARRSYHFMIDDDGQWIPGGGHVDDPGMGTSWRLWMNNLRMLGAPGFERDRGVRLNLNRTERGNTFGARASDGFMFHAQSFIINTVGVCFLGMRGAPNVPTAGWNPHDGNGEIAEDNWTGPGTPAPMETEQILKGLREVARLCEAWELDPMDIDELCTHYEVDRVHWDREAKWDITWLPYALQEAYRGFIEQDGVDRDVDPDAEHLCENANGRFFQADDVPLADWRSEHWADGETPVENTDRVGDFLRRLVRGMMDSEDVMTTEDVFEMEDGEFVRLRWGWEEEEEVGGEEEEAGEAEDGDGEEEEGDGEEEPTERVVLDLPTDGL